MAMVTEQMTKEFLALSPKLKQTPTVAMRLNA